MVRDEMWGFVLSTPTPASELKDRVNAAYIPSAIRVTNQYLTDFGLRIDFLCSAYIHMLYRSSLLRGPTLKVLIVLPTRQ
jgi:hypothetical protein